ncbi:MAG: DNA replication protein [Alphaproteobacteria bacterium]|nr:DNA replication protein [Alphaproteobacteria bacterium]
MNRPQQLPFDLGHREAFAREDLWVSGANEAAVGWLDKWPDWPAPALVIHGPAASGKTHLSRVWQKKSEASDVTAENLSSLRGLNELPKALIIDDAEKMAGDAQSETALFHLYNMQKEQGGHMLLTALTPPRDWPFVLPDLKSRLMAAPVVAVGAPDEQLMAVVLTKLFSDRQIFVPQEVVKFILARIERSFAALRAIVDAVDRKALAEKRPVTVPLVREVMNAQEKLF